MEIREAMSRLKDHFRVHDDGRPTPKLDEACRIAYECMEKQVAKKVAKVKRDYGTGYACSDCETMLWFEYRSSFETGAKHEWCPICGQRLDWSEQS